MLRGGNEVVLPKSRDSSRLIRLVAPVGAPVPDSGAVPAVDLRSL
jgi:hypothetical protein